MPIVYFTLSGWIATYDCHVKAKFNTSQRFAYLIWASKVANVFVIDGLITLSLMILFGSFFVKLMLTLK